MYLIQYNVKTCNAVDNTASYIELAYIQCSPL